MTIGAVEPKTAGSLAAHRPSTPARLVRRDGQDRVAARVGARPRAHRRPAWRDAARAAPGGTRPARPDRGHAGGWLVRCDEHRPRAPGRRTRVERWRRGRRRRRRGRTARRRRCRCCRSAQSSGRRRWRHCFRERIRIWNCGCVNRNRDGAESVQSLTVHSIDGSPRFFFRPGRIDTPAGRVVLEVSGQIRSFRAWQRIDAASRVTPAPHRRRTGRRKHHDRRLVADDPDASTRRSHFVRSSRRRKPARLPHRPGRSAERPHVFVEIKN